MTVNRYKVFSMSSALTSTNSERRYLYSKIRTGFSYPVLCNLFVLQSICSSHLFVYVIHDAVRINPVLFAQMAVQI